MRDNAAVLDGFSWSLLFEYYSMMMMMMMMMIIIIITIIVSRLGLWPVAFSDFTMPISFMDVSHLIVKSIQHSAVMRCRENSSFTKIWQLQRTLYIKTYLHLWHFVTDFFFGWEMFQTNVVDKIKTNSLCSVTFFFLKSFRLWDNVEKCCRTGQATDDNIIRRMRFACWITKATDTQNI